MEFGTSINHLIWIELVIENDLGNELTILNATKRESGPPENVFITISILVIEKLPPFPQTKEFLKPSAIEGLKNISNFNKIVLKRKK